MKKKILLGLILATAFMFTFAAGPASAGKLQKVLAGTWNFSYDWNCDGTPGTGVWYLESDGTFTTDTGKYGTWTQKLQIVKITYETGCMPTYTGILSSLKAMSGTMVCADGSSSGCFTATKAASAAETEAQEQGSDDSP